MSTVSAKIGLEEAFHQATQAGVRYVVFEGWERLPVDYPGTIRIIAVEPEALARVMGLLVVNLKQSCYRLEGCAAKLCIYRKGDGFMPDSFESQLLTRAVTKDKFLLHIDELSNFWYTLYKLLYFTTQIESKTDRLVLDSQIKAVIGTPTVPKKQHAIDFFPVNAPQRA